MSEEEQERKEEEGKEKKEDSLPRMEFPALARTTTSTSSLERELDVESKEMNE